ncbi:MAG: WXG100 family type VII secretion target [Nocardiaceae bacterium]|nr:WXG100 family type VII secretion target [Nocardiaceae bacterium]
MSDHLDADHEKVHSLGGNLDKRADEIEAARARLLNEVDAHDKDAWGDDEPGGVFGTGYLKAREQIEESLQQAAKTLSEIADGLRKTAEGLLHQEEEITGAIGSNRVEGTGK